MDFPLTLRERQNMARDVQNGTLEELQRRGQDCYRQKKYEAALRCFTEAIKQDAKASITVLDNRAATYTKLGDLRAALHDGRRMVQQDKASCVGYLRTAKILQLMGNHDMALDLYRMGIRKVPSSDPDFALLRTLHNKLARNLAPPKAIDPLQILPLELVEMTIGLLDFKHIVGLLRVSKSWLQLLTSIPALWSDLDLSTAGKRVTLGAIRQYIKRANGNILKATLDRFGSNEERIPRYITTRCRALQELRIPAGLIGASILEATPSASNLKILSISPSCNVSCDTVSQLLHYCPNLERAEFFRVSGAASRPTKWEGDLPKLRTLILDSPQMMRGKEQPPLALKSLLPMIPNIHTLSIQGWRTENQPGDPHMDLLSLPQLQHLNISRLIGRIPPRLPSSLRTLEMAQCHITYLAHNGGSVGFSHVSLPQLTHLSLAQWPSLSLEQLRAFLEPSRGELIHLDISGCYDIMYEHLEDLITLGLFKKIEILKLKACMINDEVAILLARNGPRLKVIDLACTKVSGVGVKALVTGLQGKLERLCLDECRSTSIDAVEFARSRGVKVAFGFPDSIGGGKRHTADIFKLRQAITRSLNFFI